MKVGDMQDGFDMSTFKSPQLQPPIYISDHYSLTILMRSPKRRQLVMASGAAEKRDSKSPASQELSHIWTTRLHAKPPLDFLLAPYMV
jgi:hypothetical protein